MAINNEVFETVEVCKAKVISNNLMSDSYKQQLLKVLNIFMNTSTTDSTEEKIEKLENAIYCMVLSQITYLVELPEIISSINSKKCKDCPALIHTNTVEEEEKNKKLIEQLKKSNGINTEPKEEIAKTWSDVIKQLLIHPGVWIFGAVLVISPYGVDIIKAILDYFAK